MQPNEELIFIDDNSGTYVLDGTVDDRWVAAASGLGMAEPRHITAAGYMQDGETYLDTVLRPRTISLRFYRAYADRAAMFEGTHEFLRVFAPNKGGTLRRVVPDIGTVEIDVHTRSGFDVPDADNAGGAVQAYVCQLVAHDPVWKEATEGTSSATATVSSNMSVPLYVPLYVGSEGEFGTVTINYTGSWKGRPRIVLDGPVLNPRITHVERDVVLHIRDSVPAGGSIVVTCDDDAPTITRDGVDIMGRLEPGSNIHDFYLEYGTNKITITADSVSPGTSVATITYRRRFVGV